MATIYDFEVRDIDGQPVTLAAYRGKVLLIVNTASKCGFTPQYAGLERLHQTYGPRGFAVLGFPCNQFGSQEPGTAEQIKTFCTLEFGVDFPLFAKIDVNGENADPLYKWLKAQAKGVLGLRSIKWNFTKFLVGRDGVVVGRFAPTTTPDALKSEIEKLL